MCRNQRVLTSVGRFVLDDTSWTLIALDFSMEGTDSRSTIPTNGTNENAGHSLRSTSSEPMGRYQVFSGMEMALYEVRVTMVSSMHVDHKE